MNLCSEGEIRALLGRHGFHFSKAMGQNFLIDARVPARIARESGAGPGSGVLEIGPGIGALTVELSHLAGRVAAVELDRRLLPLLAETLAGSDNVEVIPGDILKLDLPALVRERFPGLTPMVCANLPYNITAPAITALLECGVFASLTLMVQREVARRICAAPGTGDYGAFSVLCQYFADCSLLFEVPPACFLPAPKVTSAVVRLQARPRPEAVDDEAHFLRVVRAAFAQRRKTLRNALGSALRPQLSKEAVARTIALCGLPPEVRGERLGLEEFAALSRALRAEAARGE